MSYGDRVCNTCAFYGRYPTENTAYNYTTGEYETQIVNELRCRYGLYPVDSRTCLYYRQPAREAQCN